MAEKSLHIDTQTGEMYIHDATFVAVKAFDTIGQGDIHIIIGDRRWTGRADSLMEREPKQEIMDRTIPTHMWNQKLTKEDIQGF